MKLAIITGGSKGLGKSLVDTYHHKGFNVLEYSRSGDSEHTVRCDFSDPKAASFIVESSLSSYKDDKFSEIILINNVGAVDPIGPISEYASEAWIANININFTASILTSGGFLTCFQNHPCNKSIVFISSGAAVKSKHGWSLYCAAKAGLERFSKTLSLEQASQTHPIKSIIIDPAIIDTAMQSSIRNSDKRLFPELDRFIGFKEQGHLLSPTTVAERVYNIVASNTDIDAKYNVS